MSCMNVLDNKTKIRNNMLFPVSREIMITVFLHVEKEKNECRGGLMTFHNFLCIWVQNPHPGNKIVIAEIT